MDNKTIILGLLVVVFAGSSLYLYLGLSQCKTQAQACVDGLGQATNGLQQCQEQAGQCQEALSNIQQICAPYLPQQ